MSDRLSDEQRNRIEQAIYAEDGCVGCDRCDRQADALAPLVAQMLADARAEALREAAEAWDDRSERNLSRLKRLADEHYRAGGPSMPAIWLRDRAEASGREGERD